MELFMSKPNRYAIINDIKEKISNGTLEPGSRLEVTSEIAKRYSVALVTAQVALQHLSEEGLITRLPGKGTYVSKSKKTPQTEKEVLIIGSTQDKYWLELYFNIIVDLKKIGINAQCIDVDTKAPELKKILHKKYLMIILPHSALAENIQKEFPEQNIISLNINDPFRFKGHIVCSNLYFAAYEGTKHLINHGHKKIACFCNAGSCDTTSDIRSFLGNETVAGYYQAMTDNNLSDMLLMSFISGGESEKIVHDFFRAGKIPTAVYSSIDHRSKEFVKTISSYSLNIPDDIALVSSGNSVWSEAFDFTSFDIQKDKMAQSCVDIIKDTHDGRIQKDEFICRQIMPKLIIRKSCGSQFLKQKNITEKVS